MMFCQQITYIKFEFIIIFRYFFPKNSDVKLSNDIIFLSLLTLPPLGQLK